MTNQKPCMLVILDGFGYSPKTQGNAIAQANMPFWHFLLSRYPSTLLEASGTAVGLLPGYIGNSQVGHLTLGAGRSVPSILKKIHDAINDKTFFSHSLLIEKLSMLKQQQRSLHIMGLLSDAGVHSHELHLQALLKLAKEIGISRVFIHAFLDGRDVLPFSAKRYLEKLEQFCSEIGCGTLASIQGRFYAMDRDNNWDRTEIAYKALCGFDAGEMNGKPWKNILETYYDQKISDEFLPPTLCQPDGNIKPGDGVIFFNFRPDRARQLTECFINPQFSHFLNSINTGNDALSFFLTPHYYKAEFSSLKNDVLFACEQVEQTLLDELADQLPVTNRKVFIIAETEKYAHVTYFFRGMRDIQLPHEERVIIASKKEKTYIHHPEMSAQLITNALIYSLRQNITSFYLVNYANPDMVGHSGSLSATIKACEFIDQQLALLWHEVVERLGGTMIITADHGNAEEKINEAGNQLTSHTCNPVPLVIVDPLLAGQQKNIFAHPPVFNLAHVTPTILRHFKLSVPACMEQDAIFFDRF